MGRLPRGRLALRWRRGRAPTVKLQLYDDEGHLYDAIAALSRRILRDGTVTSAHRFGLRTLLREAGSSAAATTCTKPSQRGRSFQWETQLGFRCRLVIHRCGVRNRATGAGERGKTRVHRFH